MKEERNERYGKGKEGGFNNFQAMAHAHEMQQTTRLRGILRLPHPFCCELCRPLVMASPDDGPTRFRGAGVAINRAFEARMKKLPAEILEV